MRSQDYQATLQLASVCICLKRPASAESLKIPKPTKIAQHEQCTIEHVLPEKTSEQEEKSSDQEQEDVEQEVTISPPQAFPSMFIPYIEGPKMDWTVKDNLYNRFLKWNLK